MVWCSPRASHSAQSFKVVEQFVFELPTLVVMYTCRETKSGDKLIVYLLSSSTGCLVVCRISLCISSETRPSVRVQWVACGTCSVPGNFFQVGVCSRYNARSDWLIVTGPRADYGLAKTKQNVIKKPYNKLLTNRASSSRTGEYWPCFSCL